MDEELPVDDKGASSSPAPEEDAQSTMSGSANNVDMDENSYGDRKTSYIGHHQLGVVTDLPVDESEGIGFDVVAVHGIHGESRATWFQQPPNCEPRTWLTGAFSDATSKPGRVSFYGYDTSENSGRCYTLNGVYQEAGALLDQLLSLRTSDMANERLPIYFVSHDIGGLIVKAALVLAKSNPKKYSDIVDSTRAIVFLGYPHAPRTRVALQQQISRLLSLRGHDYPEGHMDRLVKSLSKTIVEVNDAFIHTRMVTQSNLVNIISGHEDPEQRVFDTSTATWGSPFELRFTSESPHRQLPGEIEARSGEVLSPLEDLPDRNWLAGDLPNDLFHALGDMVHEAAPVYPTLESEQVSDNGELDSLLDTHSSRILHIECPSGADRASEMVRNYLHVNRRGRRMLLYHRFSAHDVRFNNIKAMLATFVAQIAYSQLETMSTYIDTMVKEYDASKAQTLEDMFYYWDFLRSDSYVVDGLHVLGCLDECDDSALWFLSQFQSLIDKAKAESAMRIVIVTTKGTAKGQLIADALSKFPSDLVRRMDYTPPSSLPLQAEFELSMLVQEDARYATDGFQEDLRGLFSACVDDEMLCRLLVESLKANEEYPISVPPLLLEYGKTHNPELVFESVLQQMPEERQPWAQRILSWVLVSYRSLRTSELCRVSNLCFRGKDETDRRVGGPQLPTILRHFLGVLVVIDGEVHFSHPAIRAWLNSEMEAKPESEAAKPWYRRLTARDRHLHVVQTCLEHLRDDTNATEVWAAQLPYATQFWTSHYRATGPIDGVAKSIFGCQSTLKRWIEAYTPSLDEACHEPLPAAAHFGLDDIVTRLLADPGVADDSRSRGQALVEAARAGELPSLRLILESYPSGLDFDDEYLHDAVKAAASCPNRDLFRELVGRIPKPPHPIPLFDNDGDNDVECKPTKPAIAVETPGSLSQREDPDDTLDPNDPFLWLADILFRACCIGEDDIVETLLSLGATPNPSQSLFVNSHTPLHAAAIRCHPGTSKVLVSAGASLTAKNDLGRTPLHSAAAYGSHEVTTLLLDHGATIDATDTNGWTPLDIACVWGKLAAVEALLEHKAVQGRTLTDPQSVPLAIAADLGYYGMTEAFLRHGFDPNARNTDGETALWLAVCNRRVDICRLLLDGKADPRLTGDAANPLLIQAVIEGNLDIVKLLVEHGADIEQKETSEAAWQRTPLNVAACQDEVDIARYLLSKNADPNVPDTEGETALLSAARFGNTELVRLLAKAEGNVNYVIADSGDTPMHTAVHDPDTVSALFDCGADPDIVSRQLRTPLDLAISMGYLDTVKVIFCRRKDKPNLTIASTEAALKEAAMSNYADVVSFVLEAGADVNAVDNNKNQSLLSIAIMLNNNEDLVRAILEYRPDVNIQDAAGNTVLHIVDRWTPMTLVRHIVNAGAKLHIMNKRGFTPLMSAIWRRNQEITKYLLSKPAVTATLNMHSFRDRATPLHLACECGSPEEARLLIERGSDVNFDCTGRYGTPLLTATLQDGAELDTDRRQIIELLLEKGAVPTVTSGHFAHPIISASLTCTAWEVELLINAKASVDVQDSFDRKPVHLACYNSLEVLKTLDVPDSDFAAKDAVGRVPLHYAVLSGNVDLVEEVVARSERVGIGIDVKDKDGWTPLLWAARASNVGTWGWRRSPEYDGVISFLFAKGASTMTSVPGLNREWTALDIANYHRAYSISDLLAKKGVPRKVPSGPIKRGNGGYYTCSYCLIEMWGVCFYCTTCFDDTGLCFKCYESKDILHPHHDFKEEGFEVDDQEYTGAASDAPGSADGQEPDDEQDNPGFIGDDFDDEIVGDDDGSIMPDTEGSAAVGDEVATVASVTSRRPVGHVRARAGALR